MEKYLSDLLLKQIQKSSSVYKDNRCMRVGFFGVLFVFLRKAEAVCREKHVLNFE